MAKIQREQAVRDRRARKAEKREARIASAAIAKLEPPVVLELLDGETPHADADADVGVDTAPTAVTATAAQ